MTPGGGERGGGGVDRRGVRHVVELDLDEDESQKFAHSADVLRTVMREAGL